MENNKSRIEEEHAPHHSKKKAIAPQYAGGATTGGYDLLHIFRPLLVGMACHTRQNYGGVHPAPGRYALSMPALIQVGMQRYS